MVLGKTDLGIFTERLAADELLFELRAGDWRPLPPSLIKSDPPSSDPTLPKPSPAFTKPRYLVAILTAREDFGHGDLEITLLESDYRDALCEIDDLGYLSEWQAFFRTNQRLYRVERRSSNLKKGETCVVTQNRATGAAHRRAMSCIWRRAVIRPLVAA